MFITLTSIEDGKDYQVNPNFIVVIAEKKGATVVMTSSLILHGDKTTSWSIAVKKSREEVLEMIKELQKEENERQLKLSQINMEIFFNKYMKN